MIRSVDSTGSTNTDLAALARGGAPEGDWLRADRQTAGKGRQNRIWSSPPGNLHASTLVRLRPGDPPAPSLALVAAVALHEAVGAFAVQTVIKWPNDLIHGNGKLAGILLEREGDAVIVGFGVNLAHHPRGLERPVTSLAALGVRTPCAAEFLDVLAQCFEQWRDRWRREGLGPIRDSWLAAAHPPGTRLRAGEDEGIFEGLEEDGGLRLRRDDGSLLRIHAGDVFLV